MTKCCQRRQYSEAFPLTWSWCRHQLWAAAWWCWRSPRRQLVKEECSPRHSGVQSLPPWPAATLPPSETSKCAWLHLHMYSAYVQCTAPSIFCLWVQVGMSTHPSSKDTCTTQWVTAKLMVGHTSACMYLLGRQTSHLHHQPPASLQSRLRRERCPLYDLTEPQCQHCGLAGWPQSLHAQRWLRGWEGCNPSCPGAQCLHHEPEEVPPVHHGHLRGREGGGRCWVSHSSTNHLLAPT